jgi:uncharacterized damage-inducible protein DinB
VELMMAKRSSVKTKKTAKAKPSRSKRPTKTMKKAGAPARPMPGPREQFLQVFNTEHATTLRVIRAYPIDQGSFQPHTRSHSAKRLIWTFAQEQDVVARAIDGTLDMPPTMAQEPATLAEVIAAYEAGVKDVARKVARMPDSRLASTVRFFTGPGTISDVPLIDVMWIMLMDSIHHRGQLSVYVRMAGGLVPSIYGPSADEPWM